MRLKPNSKTSPSFQGFTLIELMFVVSIIAILAAMAIPNFISYRNKAFCSRAETDARYISDGIANYFVLPSHTIIAKNDLATTVVTNANWGIISTDPNTSITITVQDDSGRCPAVYQRTSTNWNANIYTKLMRL